MKVGKSGRIASRLVPLPGGKTAPEWVHIVPIGRWEGHHSGIPIEIGPAEVAAIVANFAKRGIDLVFDWEHQTLTTLTNGKPAPASGWSDELQGRDDGVWAHMRVWTPVAKGQLEAEEYKYCSPVLEFGSVDPHTGEPEGLWVSSVALTNIPFFAGDLTPVVSRQGGVPMNLLAALVALLGLPAESTEQQALDAVQALKDMTPKDGGEPTPDATAAARAQLADTVIEKMGWKASIPANATDRLKKELAHEGYVAEREVMSLRAELEAAKVAGSEDSAERLAARALEAGKITPKLKDHFVAMARRNMAEATAWMDAAPVIVPFGTQTPPKNKGKVAGALTPAELAACSALGMKPEDYVKGRPATA